MFRVEEEAIWHCCQEMKVSLGSHLTWTSLQCQVVYLKYVTDKPHLTLQMQTYLCDLDYFSRSIGRSALIGHWRFNLEPGSETTMPETPPDLGGLQAASEAAERTVSTTRARPEPGSVSAGAGRQDGPADQLSRPSESPRASFTESSHSFASFPLLVCSFMELQSCPLPEVSLLTCFLWASGENELSGLVQPRY